MSKKHILIIEDEKDIAELLEYNLGVGGYYTCVANNGETGLKVARKQNPDLILLDLMLPGIQGLDVCQIIKTDEDTENIPIVMLTALGQEENIVKGLESGADDYITKPFSFKILLARIESVLRRGKLEEQDLNKEIKIFDVTIKPRTREVIISNAFIELTFI